MSADLLAAFGGPESANTNTRHESLDNLNSISPTTANSNHNSGQREQDSWILQSQPLPRQARIEPLKPLWKQDSDGADVLFDASDNDDDFGEFEEAAESTGGAKAHIVHPNPKSEVDLLGLDDFSDLQIGPQSHTSSTPLNQIDINIHHSDENVSSEYHVSQVQPYQLEPKSAQDQHTSIFQREEHQDVTIQEPAAEDDDWGNFEEVEARPEPKHSPARKTQVKPVQHIRMYSTTSDDWDALEDSHLTPTPSIAQPSTLAFPPTNTSPESTSTSTPTLPIKPPTAPTRPTNIPPPSTLLQLLPKIYSILTQQSRTAPQPPSLAPSIAQIYTTTARLIAGRTHRWKRDTHLSQSTRISQAGLKNTGMKLTALDKGETVKEDQEAQESVSAWQRNAAALNAVMLKAKVPRPPMSLSVNMAVRVAGGAAVLNSRECCAVCGLRRNERVNGIDVKVDDTFGEFWVEHWGHKDCCEFWYTYEDLLDKR